MEPSSAKKRKGEKIDRVDTDDALSCVICFDMLWDPIICVPCGHTFCAKCCGYGTKSPKCAICRQEVLGFFINRLVRQLVATKKCDTAEPEITICIRSLDGKNGNILVPYSTSLEGLYVEAAKATDTFIDQLRLIFSGRSIPRNPNISMRCLKIPSVCTMHAVLKLRGD